MSAAHATPSGERLAKQWHIFGAFVAGVSVVIGVGGLCWHLFAVREHDKHLEQLERENPYD